MLYSGKEIEKLIPQRYPIVQVDKVISADENVAVTGLSVSAGNCFILQDGRMAENGLVEHIAQSASALAGHRALTSGAVNPPVGFIGEVKRCRFYGRPAVGAELTTTISMGAEVNGITIVTGETREGDTLLAETQMKIFVEDEKKSQQAVTSAATETLDFDNKDFFRILSTEGDRVHVELCPDCWLYHGHFPGRPVSPGVCNIGMIKACAEHLSGKSLIYSEIKVCRLVAVVSPEICPTLDVIVNMTETEAGYQIQATIKNDEQVFMELKGTAREIEN